jgi:plastocyanin
VVIATDITAFHIIGGLTAIWAVTLAAIGITRHGFPGKESGERVVIGISVLLVAGSIATAVGTAKSEPKSGGEVATATPGGGGGAAPPQQPSAPSTPAAPAPPAGTPLQLSADPSGALKFDKTSLSAKAGKVTIDMKNPAPLQHNISITGSGVNQMGKTVSTGQTSTVTATLKPGTYTFYCSVPGHRQAGMQGTLTVK